MIADSTKWGYWMDGLCDLTGTIFFMIAVILICQRSLHLRRTVTFQILPIFYYILAPFKRKISKISLPSDSDLDTEAFLSTVGTFLIRFWKISWIKEVFFRKLYYRVKRIWIFRYLKQKSNNYFYWFTLIWVKGCILTWMLDLQFQYWMASTKGQLVSICLFGVIVWTKIAMKIL